MNIYKQYSMAHTTGNEDLSAFAGFSALWAS